MSEKQFRFPGPKSFQESDQHLFVGRKDEIRQLASLIDLHRITVVFGASGTGKSSLIHAGVIPQLRRKKDYQPQLVRLLFREGGAQDKEGNYLAANVKAAFPISNRKEWLDDIPFEDDSLWWHFKQLQIQDNNSKTYLLIMDQFEELGSHNKEIVESFLKQLNNLISYAITTDFKSALYDAQENGFPVADDNVRLLYEPIKIKLVIIIKSEKLGLLHSIRKYILDILQNCYEVTPLSVDKAKLAIVEPAAQELPNFTTAFLFDPKAIDAIITYLQEKTDTSFYESPGIEASLLQIICSQIEQTIVPSLPGEKPMVSKSHLIIEELAENYYSDRLERLIAESSLDLPTANLLRNFIETELIASQGDSLYRQQVFEGRMPVAYASLELNILGKLVDAGILRRDSRYESRGVQVFYEISHEKLLQPIRRNRQRRLEKPSDGTEITSVESSDEHSASSRKESFLSEKHVYAIKQKADMLAHEGKYEEAIKLYDEAIALDSDNDEFHYDKATTLLNWEQNHEAIDAFLDVLRLNPDYYASYNEIGRAYLKLKNYDLAYENFSKVISFNKKVDYAWYNMGLVRYYQGRYTEAVDYFTQTLKVNPDYTNAVVNRGYAYALSKQYENALDDFNKLEKLEPGSYSSFYGRGFCFVEKGKDIEFSGDGKDAGKWYREAIKEFSKSLALKPNDKLALYNRGYCYRGIGDFEKAHADFAEVVRLDSSYFQGWYEKGMSNKHLNRSNEALQDFARTLSLQPDDQSALFERGLIYYGKRDYESASKDFSAVIKLNPNYYQALYNLALCFANLGDHSAAISQFTKTLAINPEYGTAYYERGRSKSSMGDYEGALEDFTHAIQQKFSLDKSYYQRGTVNQKLQRYQQALDDFGHSVAANPDYVDGYFGRALLHYAKEDYLKAIDDFDKVTSLKSDYYQAHYNKGLCYSNLKRYKEAKHALDLTLQIIPDYSNAFYERGRVHEGSNNYEGAIEDYSRVIELENDPVDAYYGRAHAKYYAGDYQSALDDLDIVKRLNPHYPQLHLIRGALLFKLGQLEQALVETNLELEQDAQSDYALCNRADIFRKMNKPKEAHDDAMRALQINPTDGYPHATLALLALDRGDEKEFFEKLEKAVDAGYPLQQEMKSSDDFRAIQQHPQFKKILKKAEASKVTA